MIGNNREIERYEEMVDTKDCFQEVKNNYPAMGARDFEFEFINNNFDKREVNTILSEVDYDCWINDIVLNIDGTVLVKCKCDEEE